jgi:hypothetical protein
VEDKGVLAAEGQLEEVKEVEEVREVGEGLFGLSRLFRRGKESVWSLRGALRRSNLRKMP